MKTIPSPGFVAKQPKHVKVLLCIFAIVALVVFMYYIAEVSPMFGRAAVPAVESSPATEQALASAKLNGNITSNGGKNLISRGFEYGATTSYGSKLHDMGTNSGFVYNHVTGVVETPQYFRPYGVAVDSGGNVYVGVFNKARIQKFNSAGTFLTSWDFAGGFGDKPYSVAVDSNDNVYVNVGSSIKKYNGTGTLLDTITLNVTFFAFAIDSSNNIYIPDVEAHSIKKYDNSGTLLTEWGSSGTGNGQLSRPYAVALDADNNVYVTDTDNNRVEKFSDVGVYLDQWGSSGTGDGQFKRPIGIAVNNDGAIFVADQLNHRVQKFSTSGDYLGEISSSKLTDSYLEEPIGVATDTSGHLYIADPEDQKFSKYDVSTTTGTFNLRASSLTCGTTYHYRAYATNADGTSYGDDQAFTTSDCNAPTNLPVVTTNSYNAPYRGTVQAFDTNTIFERGFEFGETTSYGQRAISPPDYYANSGDDFNADLSMVSTFACGVTYHYRAYAINADGVGYGSDATIPPTTCNFIQTDFSVSTSYTPSIIHAGDTVTYHYTITNNSPYPTYIWGSLYIVVPDELTPTDATGSNTLCYPMIPGFAPDMSNAFSIDNHNFSTKYSYYSNFYHDKHLYICTLDAGQSQESLAAGQSKTIDVTGTANADFVAGTTTSSAFYVNIFGTESQVYTAMTNAYYANVDWFTLTSNNVSNDVYELPPPNQLPSASMTAPAEGQSINYGQSVNLTASASDSDGTIANVDLFLDGTSVGTVSSEPYTITAYGLASGPHTIYAVATDNDGGSTNSSTINFTVADTAPTVTTDPATNLQRTSSKLNGTITSAGSASVSSRGFEYGADTNYGQTASENTNTDMKYVRSFGDGSQFPAATAVDSSGNLFSAFGWIIQKYNSSGVLQTEWGSNGSGNGQFSQIYGLAVDSLGNVYATDLNNRVQKFTNNGVYITQWGSTGLGDNQFQWPTGVAIDNSDNVFVVDYLNANVQEFRSNGTFVARWGTAGTGPGQLYYPGSISVDLAGNVYVGNLHEPDNLIQKFTSSGAFLTSWGSEGTGDGQFTDPLGITTDYTGNVFVVDSGNNRIQQFDPQGGYIGQWGSFGTANSNLSYPSSIASDLDGHFFVADTNNGRVKKFSAMNDGSFSLDATSLACGTMYHYRAFATNVGGTGYGNDATFTTQACGAVPVVTTGAATGISTTTVTMAGTYNPGDPSDNNFGFAQSWGSFGSDPGQFIGPNKAATDYNGQGDVYITDSGDSTVKEFDRDGNFVRQWGGYGSGNGQFSFPDGIAVDSQHYVYVVDSGNNRIQKFNSVGTYLGQWGSNGSDPGQFRDALGIAVDNSDNLYVADDINGNVQKFDSFGSYITQWTSPDENPFYPTDVTIDTDGYFYVSDGAGRIVKLSNDSDGSLVAQWGSYGSGNGQFQYPIDIQVSTDNKVYVTDAYNDNLQVFDTDGNYLTTYGSSGSDTQEFSFPDGLARGYDGVIYVVDHSNQRIQVIGPVSERGFEYGTTTSYGTSVLDGKRSIVNFSIDQSGLICGTTYHYRAYAVNNVGTGYGEDATFTTDACALQTDFSLTKTLTTPAPINSGNTVTYHFKLTNEGPNTAGMAGNFYDVIPHELTLAGTFVANSTYPNLNCIDTGLADNSETYYATHYSGYDLVNCYFVQYGVTPTTLATNASVEFDIVGTANADFVSGSTQNRSLYVNGTGNEDDFGAMIQDAINTDVDMFTLPSNNVSNVTYTVTSNQAPSVSITAPTPNQAFAFGATVDLTATASDPDGTISGVELFLDGVSVGTVNTGPYTISASGLTAGTHTVSAIATDNDGATTTSSTVTFTVGSAAPTVTTQAAASVTKTTSVLNGTVTSIGSSALTVRGFQYGKTTSYGLSVYDATSASGAYSLTATTLACGTTYHYRAYAANSVGTAYGGDVSFTTTVCQLPPTVVITAPANNQTFGATVTSVQLASTAASPTSTIDRVEFFVDGNYVGSVSTPPFTMTALGLSVGTHILVAKAYDVLGASAVASPVTFYVQPPTTNPPTTSNPGTTPTTPVSVPSSVAGNQQAGGVSELGRQQTSNAKKSWLDFAFGHRLFEGLPFALILLLLLMALLYARQATKEYILRNKILQAIKRYDATLKATNDYLAVTSHYLNTPVAIMSGAVELIASLKVVSDTVLKNLQTRVKEFSTAVGELTTQNQTLAAQTHTDSPELHPQVDNPLKDKAVLIPSGIALICLVLANLLLIKVSVLNTSTARIIIEVGLFVLAIMLVALSKRYKDVALALRDVGQKQLNAQAALMEKRRDFVDAMGTKLEEHQARLEVVGKPIKKIPQAKLYFNGLAMLGALTSGLRIIHNTTNMKSETPLFALTAFSQKLVRDFEPLAKSRGVTIGSEVAKGTNIRIHPDEIRQLLSSLVDNAVRFTDKGGTVKIRGQNRFKKVVLAVSDTGIGISEDKLKGLFEPFSRATDTMSFDYQGVGLNLYINKVIVARLGGSISIDSKLAMGTTVTVTLPSGGKQDALIVPETVTPSNVVG